MIKSRAFAATEPYLQTAVKCERRGDIRGGGEGGSRRRAATQKQPHRHYRKSRSDQHKSSFLDGRVIATATS